MPLSRTCVFLSGLAVAAGAHAAGNLDGDFADNGRRIVFFDGGGNNMDDALAMDVTSNGTVVLAGNERIDATHDCIAVVRLLPNGSPDTTFSGDGKFVQNALCSSASLRVNAVKIDTAGRIVFAGAYTPDSNGQSQYIVGRIKADGSALDDGFGFGGITTPSLGGYTYAGANAIALQADGKIVAAGYATVNFVGSLTAFAVTRQNADGTADASFNSSGYQIYSWGTSTSDPLNDVATAIAIQGDGKIVVAGTSQQTATGADFGVVRLNVNGSFDTAFGGNGTGARLVDFGSGCKDDIVTSIAYRYSPFSPAGAGVVIAGTNCVAGNDWDYAVAVLDEDGALDNDFNGTGRRTVGFDIGGLNRDVAKGVALENISTVTLGPTHITLGGFALNTQTAGSGYDFALTRLTFTGGVDTSFGTNGRATYPINLGSTNNDFANALVVRGRKAWIGGSLQRVSTGDYDFGVLRLFANDTIFGSQFERR